jgi:hypothetical protein
MTDDNKFETLLEQIPNDSNKIMLQIVEHITKDLSQTRLINGNQIEYTVPNNLIDHKYNNILYKMLVERGFTIDTTYGELCAKYKVNWVPRNINPYNDGNVSSLSDLLIFFLDKN